MAGHSHMLALPASVNSSTREPEPLAWSDPELHLWQRAYAHLQHSGNATVQGRPTRMLDVGCGEGRITLKFRRLFGESVCLEADASRMATATRRITREYTPGGVRFAQQGFEEFEGAAPGSIDAITCVHVLQHIAAAAPAMWLKKMYKLLRPGGIVVLASTYTRGAGRLTLENGLPLSPERFDAYVHGAAQGHLAVRYWNPNEFVTLVRASGFAVVEHNPFSMRDLEWQSQYVVAVKDEHGGFHTSALPDPPLDRIFYSATDRRRITNWMRLRRGGSRRTAGGGSQMAKCRQKKPDVPWPRANLLLNGGARVPWHQWQRQPGNMQWSMFGQMGGHG
eukprot:CAMPEP_0115862098 /NCGR_PEP_ID=MMETSP0287-20121206/18000_1 /TAXON_ID=412157 /ORGANISM="Chrysochromulina rotalis, Strain UIO044" /LENGTH=335 /DNA_ID=CAMNT_0003316507 /DNA_START=1 /DNA_END=1008 /DNA_ORIENTATION=+